MNKEDSFKEKFKQAILSTVKVISEDNFSNPKNKKQLNEENLKAVSYTHLTLPTKA